MSKLFLVWLYVINDSECVNLRPVLIHTFSACSYGSSCLSPLRNLIKIQFSDSSHHFHKHTHIHTHTSSYSMGLKNCHNCHKLSSDLVLIQGCLLGERRIDRHSSIDFYTDSKSNWQTKFNPKNNPGSWSFAAHIFLFFSQWECIKQCLYQILYHARLNVA